MMRLSYDLTQGDAPAIGLIVLQVDQRIERDFRKLLPGDVALHVTRVPSGRDVTPDTLQRMAVDIPDAVRLLPPAADFRAIGYACTSGAAQIGSDRVADLVRGAARVGVVSDPLRALLAACRHLGLRRLALVSPYIASVSGRLRDALQAGGVSTTAFASFDIAEEARVARISPASVCAAARQLGQGGGVDGIFLSCTNLATLDIIGPLESELGLPVLSSNQVLAWDLCRHAGIAPGPGAPGALFDSPRDARPFVLSDPDVGA